MSDSITLVQRIQPQDFDVFIGMDVDKQSIVLRQVDHPGAEKSLSMPYQGAGLLGYVRRHLRGKRIAFAYEVGPTGFGLHDTLAQAGYPCLVVMPAAVPTPRGQRVRTNRLDARKLALQLRGGSLQGIRVPSEDYRMLREYVRLRKMHMSATPGGYWSKQLIQQLREYSCAPALQFKIGSLLTSLEFARLQAAATLAQMRRFVQTTPEMADSVRYAMSVPGVGWIIATYAVARIGDWRLLGDSPQMASFFGLTQREDSTGEGADRGPITKAGDPVMRSMLIEGAWSAISKDPELRSFYERVKATHAQDKGARIAIVAVARKLACRLHCVLKERREYQVRTPQE
jgi:transposase